jgi:hypothetical protein
METLRTVLARHWKLGTLAFVIVMALCAISVWRRQARYNVVFTFSAPSITHRIQRPGLPTVQPQSIVDRLRLALAERSLRAAVTQYDGRFTVVVDSVPHGTTARVEEQLAAVYGQLADELNQTFDPAPISERLSALDARLELISETLSSPALSAYERYALADRAIELRAQSAEARKELEIVSVGVLAPPARQLYRAEQLDAQVLYVLGFTLSVFVAAATMLLADSLRGNG